MGLCVACAFNTYQNQASQTACINCPPGSSTRFTQGSTSINACQSTHWHLRTCAAQLWRVRRKLITASCANSMSYQHVLGRRWRRLYQLCSRLQHKWAGRPDRMHSYVLCAGSWYCCGARRAHVARCRRVALALASVCCGLDQHGRRRVPRYDGLRGHT
jgi:hypothetical protein